jgi:hypothetical protein
VHLTDAEFVEHVEGLLPPERVAHVERCEVCRQQLEGLTSALADARGVDVPEPSPLFWNHFSAQVREAIDQPPPSRLSAFVNARWPGPALIGAAILALVVIGGFWPRAPRDGPPPVVSVVMDPVLPPDAAPDSLEADVEWTFVATMADGIDWEAVDAAGLGPRLGSAERAAEDLSPEERNELARLLREQLADGSL